MTRSRLSNVPTSECRTGHDVYAAYRRSGEQRGGGPSRQTCRRKALCAPRNAVTFPRLGRNDLVDPVWPRRACRGVDLVDDVAELLVGRARGVGAEVLPHGLDCKTSEG